MAIYVYADESGVFDKKHNKFFIFGGIILLDKDQRDIAIRKYLHAERALGRTARRSKTGELKASTLSNKHKGKLYRSLNQYHKFVTIIDQAKVLDNIFNHPKTKQRYLDYAFKIGLKAALTRLISQGAISNDYASVLDIRMDEHSTATNGKYEMREALEQEYKIGTFNQNYGHFFPPIFPNLQDVKFCLRDSAKDPLIRAADIIANRAYYLTKQHKIKVLAEKATIKWLP